eukprot:CAMPEP_0117757512 /NCGR_PEP_ID=MMETSP0947-20121206/14782_1 /TAXON_ID=44440 /ORGANISM="Chattonella subsalsa, Strain CCMP2191" /LENGTH=46 /DNA_ID= /DNA_START= /DNA_END= /DNA_ORIENTATION=
MRRIVSFFKDGDIQKEEFGTLRLFRQHKKFNAFEPKMATAKNNIKI